MTLRSLPIWYDVSMTQTQTWMRWCDAIDSLAPDLLTDEWDETKVTVHELHDMWETGTSPDEAVSIITFTEWQAECIALAHDIGAES